MGKNCGSPQKLRKLRKIAEIAEKLRTAIPPGPTMHDNRFVQKFLTNLDNKNQQNFIEDFALE